MAVNSKGLKFAVAIVIMIIITIPLALYIEGFPGGYSTAGNGNTISQNTAIIDKSSRYTVYDGSYRFIGFNVTTPSKIAGSFSSTNGVDIFIIYSADSSSFNSHGIPNNYLYTTGKVESGNISTSLNHGNYDLLLFNDNGLNLPTVVTFVTNLTLT